MLNNSQKYAVRTFSFHDTIWKKEDGTLINTDKGDLQLPSFFEIKENLLKSLQKVGLRKIEQVKPYNANCIIRVYQKLNHKYESNFISLYGVQCFIKTNEIWTTQNNIRINFSKCIIRSWLFQDEYIDFDCDFFDCYVKIS